MQARRYTSTVLYFVLFFLIIERQETNARGLDANEKRNKSRTRARFLCLAQKMEKL